MLDKKMKILRFGEPVLKQAAKPVTVFHKKLHILIDSMKATLDNRNDGAAIAANQIGVLKRITVIDYLDEYFEMINPEILNKEGEQIDYEGCLSYPSFYGKVSRAEFVKVKYQDRYGKENIIERTGKMARCIQHEIDHLDGILFVDRMTEKELIHSDDKTKISLDEVLEIANGMTI